MSYRDDLAALDARVEALRQEASAKLDELEHTKQLADDARRLVRERVLEAEIATPCTVSWDTMKGDARVRHCGHCRKHVYNFAELTRDEIDALIVKHEGSLCARFFVRADGTMLTKDCASNIRIRPRQLAVTLGAAAIAAAATLAPAGAFVDAYRAPPREVPAGAGTWLTGDVAVPAGPLDEPVAEPSGRMELEGTAMGGVNFHADLLAKP